MPHVSVVPFIIRTKTINPSTWGISPVRQMSCTMSTRHSHRSLHGGSSTDPCGTPPSTTVWSAPHGDGCVCPSCVGVSGVLLPPPPPPMGFCHSPWPGQCVFPGSGQGCVAPLSHRGYGSPPWTYPYPSMRGWAPVQTRADTTVSVWHSLFGSPILPWKYPDTPRSQLLPPPLTSRYPP